MKRLIPFFIMLLACLMVSPVFAQKVKLREGSFNALKGTTAFNVQYDYSNMTVTTRNVPEAEYIAKKKEEYNKKESGKGDKWEQSWIRDRNSRYAVQFKEEFDKQSGAKIGDNPNEKYTIVVKTIHTETGYNVGISRRNAYIDCEVLVVETAHPDQVLARVTMDNVPGGTFGGFDFDSGSRLQECYAKAGKVFGKMIKKKLK